MKKLFKIEKLMQYCFENELALFPVLSELESAEDNEWYLELKSYFDSMVDLNYYDRIINRPFETIQDVYSFVQRIIALKIRTNIYQFSRLYETTILEYNPLWNVDGVEIREIERDVDKSNTTTFNNTDTNTKSGNETSVDSGSNTTTKAVTTFDDPTFRDTEKTTETPSNMTNTHTYNNVRDANEHSGTIGESGGEDESTTETLTRHGNIGVTKSTDLIDSQRNTVRYSYVEDVTHILVNEFTYLVD